jgi:hypothetical protein
MPEKGDLLTVSPDLFASKFIFEAVPFIFAADVDLYIGWKTELGTRLAIDPRAIAVVGSASLGFSLNPAKSFKSFGDGSDIDVAVVSYRHFELAWDHLRKLGAQTLGMPVEVQNAITSHKRGYVFAGTIAADFILGYLPFAAQWVPAFAHMAGITPTEGREVKARIYRDFDSLREYQLRSVLAARANLETHDKLS